MKANEFFKEFGWAKAYDIIAHIPEKFMPCYYSNVCYCMKYKKYSDRFKPRDSLINMGDLKRLVESHEIIEKFGGLDGAKKKLNSLCIFRWITPEITALEQAIADVEACQ